MIDVRMRDLVKSKEKLVQRFIDEGILSNSNVINAFRKVPREEFIPQSIREHAYDDRPLPIESGQTISAPHYLALAK